MNKTITICVFLAILIFGCSAVTIPYDPQPLAKDPREVIRQVIMEQPDKKVPHSATVTADYIEIDTTVIRRSGPIRRRIPTMITIYFNNLGKPVLYKTSWYIVAILNKNNEERYRVYTKQEDQARLLIDALNAIAVNK